MQKTRTCKIRVEGNNFFVKHVVEEKKSLTFRNLTR